MLGTPEVGPTTVRDMLIGVDELLAQYLDTFGDRPEPADVAAMRLERAVKRLTPAQWTVIEGRTLANPPVSIRRLVMQLDISQTRVMSELRRAREKIEIALEPDIGAIAEGLKADTGANTDVMQRLDVHLDAVMPDEDAVTRRARRVFRHALVEALHAPPRGAGHGNRGPRGGVRA